MSEASSPPLQSLRFGAFDNKGARVALLVVNLETGQLLGEGDADILAAIKGAIERFKPSGEGDPEQVFAYLFDEAVRPMGLTVRRIGDSDAAVHMLWDASTGMIVGRSVALDGAAPLPASVEKGLTDAIASASTRMSDELADQIEAAKSDAEAEALLYSAYLSGVLKCTPTPRLGDVLEAVDVSGLDDDPAARFLPLRVLVASRLDRHVAAARDAELLITRWSNHRPDLAAEYRNVIAVNHAKEGRLESARSIWLDLAYRTPGVPPLQRALALRSLAFSVPESDPRALAWIAEAADAYLQGGDRREAAISHVHWAAMLEHHDAGKSVAMLDSAQELFDEAGPIGDALRAATYFVRGRRLMALQQHPEALAAALQSVAIRRGLAGQEEELLSSLNLAEFIARELGDPIADALSRERAALLEEVPNSRFLLSDKVNILLKDWDPTLADEVRLELDALDEIAARVAGRTAMIIADPTLDPDAELRALEALHNEMLPSAPPGGTLTPLRLAIAHSLRNQSAPERALHWLHLILADDPLANGVARILLGMLDALGSWQEGAVVARRELALRGESFGRLMTLTHFTLGAKRYDECLAAALEARKIGADEEERADADRYIAQALAEGATLAAAKGRPVLEPVTTAEFEEKLRGFAENVRANFRMSYWQRPKGAKSHSWIASPERHAQSQLRLWLEAKFDGRVTILEEVGTGAGRLDLLVQFAGGTQVILELKMLGARYSTTYAASGADQIVHYLANRRLRLGYLVVFDARVRDNGARLIGDLGERTLTVREVFVDVRPEIEKRRNEPT